MKTGFIYKRRVNIYQHYQMQLHISETAVENNLIFLKENGCVEKFGPKKADYWKVLEYCVL